MEPSHIYPLIEAVNEDATEFLKNNRTYTNYIKWLKENGCQYPSLDFPTAFGMYGITGTKAVIDIPSLKVMENQAFLFVPTEVIISPQRARDSEISEVFESYPRYFKTHSRAADYILWVYITYEFTKGEKSFFFPYFSSIGEPEMLMDWSSEEKLELQDKFLIFESKRQEKLAFCFFESLVEVFSSYPQFFPSQNLLGTFLWAYKLVTTRSFSHGEGMVIPLADNLNHEDVYVDYLTLSKQFLDKKLIDGQHEQKDYQDFSGVPHISSAPMKSRTHLNRLQKYLQAGDEEKGLSAISNIWEVDELVSEFESSSDEEELVNDFNEESEEEGEDEGSEEESEEAEEIVVSQEGKYFVMRTGSEGGFLRGQQVFNCYGRLNNTDLLSEYGFCLLPNRYDSLYVRMVRTQTCNGKIEIPKLDLQDSTRLKDFIKVYYLKYMKINEKFLEYFRTIVVTNPHDRFRPAGELKVITQAEEVLLELKNCYATSLESDEDQIQLAPRIPIRLYFALSNFHSGYRISQKRILESQLKMFDSLKRIFWKLLTGSSMESSHWEEKTIGNAHLMYPLRNYLKDIRLNSFE